MARVNDNYLRLKSGYLFSEIARRVKEYQGAHPDAKLIRLGIGDATQPLPPAIVAVLHAAVDEMARAETFRGYGPETGYEFLTELIAKYDYGARGVTIAPDEIFVSDGSKSDAANFQELFSPDAVVALTDPVYPVYLDSNVMAGRAGAPDARGGYERIVYLPCTAENRFDPPLPDRPVDMVYLCFPNNPTGAVLGRAQLERWVDRALGEWRGGRPARALVPPPVHEVQRRAVRDPARSGRRLHARGTDAGPRDDRLLHGERAPHPRGAGGGGAHGVRRPERALHLGEDAGGPGLMGVLRQAAERGPR